VNRGTIMRILAGLWLISGFVLPTLRAAGVLKCGWLWALAPIIGCVLLVAALLVVSFLTGDYDVDDDESEVEP